MTEPTETLEPVEPAIRRATDMDAVGMAFQIIHQPDGERRFSFVGQRCLALNGVPAEAAMADPDLLYDMVLPEHQAAFAAAEAEAMAAMKPFDIEVAMRRPDGRVRWHRIASMPRRLPDGSVAWDGLQIDVTERRRIAAELEEQRRRLELAVEATGLGFWEWDVAAGLLTWSERNKALFGLAADAPVSVARYMELVHPEDVERVREAYRGALDAGGGDYSVEHRVLLPGGGVRWISSHGRVIAEAGEPTVVVGTNLDVTQRKATEERRALLMGELAHRAKNGIAVVMAIVQQTARSAQTLEGFEALLLSRLQSMATAQDLVTATGGRPVQLADVVSQTMAPFGLARFDVGELDGVTIVGEIAVGLGLLLHETATNAVKYGALSNAKGRVAIDRGDSDAGRVALCWRERGGPEVKVSSRQGFGTRLLQSALRNYGAEVAFRFDPQGFEATVVFPRGRVAPMLRR